jgi:hypothetical protein
MGRLPLLSAAQCLAQPQLHTSKNELFVIDMQGGRPQKVADRAFYASWSPDV